MLWKAGDEPREDEKINLFSGASVDLRYGEGILDFIYADFRTPMEEALGLSDLAEQLAAVLKKENPSAQTQSPREGKKIYSEAQEIAEEFHAYESTFLTVRDVAYASLYTAVCPPLFEEGQMTERQKLVRYGTCLIELQKEFLEMLEFCYDEDFYPEVLGKLYPSERLYLYRKSKHLPVSFARREQVLLSKQILGGHEMPFGLPWEEVTSSLQNLRLQPTDAEREFAEKYGLSGNPAFLTRSHTYLSTAYESRTVESMLELEFTKMLEQDVRFRKCKRCGRYFIMKGKYDTNYCDRIAEGETRNCQELAAIENYRTKIAGNEAIPIYHKYYKRYAARVKARQIKEADFKRWRYQAIEMRDRCTAGALTPAELTQWMEESFPNRKPRKQSTDSDK